MPTQPDDRPSKARVGDILAVAADNAISDREVRLWVWYRKHHVDSRGAFVSDARTAEALGWSRRTVIRVRERMVKHGILKVCRNGPRPSSYFPLPRPSEVTRAAQQHVTPAPLHGVTTEPPHDVTAVSQHKIKEVTEEMTGVSASIRDGTASTEQRRLTPAQQLVNHVIEVGLFGTRPQSYGKQAKRAESLLKDHTLECLISVVNALRARFPYNDGRAFDVFDVGRNVDKVMAELRRSDQLDSPLGSYLTPEQLDEIERAANV